MVSIDIPCSDHAGLLVVYLLSFLYTFVCCSVLTEEFFVPSLEKLAIRWRLSKDVAGATLMAVGSSGPEICVNIIDTIFGEEDLGLVSVIGSALFNICFITAMSILFAPEPLEISVRPFLRDFVFYFIAICLLTVAIVDYEVECLEAFGLLVLYALYVFFLLHNDEIFRWIDRCLGIKPTRANVEDIDLEDMSATLLREADQPESDEFDYVVTFEKPPLGFEIHPCPNYVNGVVGRRLMKHSQEHVLRGSLILSINDLWLHGLPTTDLVERVLSESQNPPIMMCFRAKKWMLDTPITTNDMGYQARKGVYLRVGETLHRRITRESLSLDASDLIEVDREREHSEHEGCCARVMHAIACPVHTLFSYTIPKSLYLSFVGCLFWILVISYCLTQLTKLSGCALKIDMVLMGMVFLAAGTSVPDMLCSITVAKKMEGDMCISNISGSNISNCLLGIGLPWFIETLLKGEPHKPATENLHFYFIFLLSSMFLSLLSFCGVSFRLYKFVALLFLIVYVGFCGFVYYIEYHVSEPGT